jgi:hypothetical protein
MGDMAMSYQNFREVVLAVREKYEGAKQLSRNGTTCFYSHDINGIGCAIGCLVSPEEADKMENEMESLFCLADMGYMGNMGRIDISDLCMLQKWHDTSGDVDSFRKKLDKYLAQSLA